MAAAWEKIVAWTTRPDRYRAALHTGIDPALIQQCTTQVQAYKAASSPSACVGLPRTPFSLEIS